MVVVGTCAVPVVAVGIFNVPLIAETAITKVRGSVPTTPSQHVSPRTHITTIALHWLRLLALPPPLQLRYIVYVPQAEAPDEDDIADAPTTISEDTNRRLDEILASSQASTATRISDAAEDAETR